MTRAALRSALVAHEPADAKEAADRRAMLAFLEELPEPFSRAQRGAHFTASALVVDAARTRTALVHHRKLGLWVQPGGHLDPADESIAAALREVGEETGLTAALAGGERPVHLDIHEIPERPEMPAHLHLDVRFLVVAHGDVTPSPESLDVRWLTFDDAVRRGDASLRRLIRAARAAPKARHARRRTGRGA